MIPTLHGQTTLYSNILTDVRTAREAGYRALELATEKLLRYLNAGLEAASLREAMRRHEIEPACIDILADVEVTEPQPQKQMLELAGLLIETARTLHCPTIQLNPFRALAERPWAEARKLTARNIARVADMGRSYGVRFQIEGAAWTPYASLERQRELIAESERENVGLVIDTWHLWASHETTPADVARLEQELIYGVHLSDGKRPAKGEPIGDEKALRGYLPGDGDIPLREWMEAVKSTGFDGHCAGEILSPQLWERDHLHIARDMRERMEEYL